LHSGLDDDLRNKNQELFLTGQIPIIIATNAFGMGIDKPDVRFVIHYSLTSNLERYYQEVGRAGRDGEQSIALLIYCPEDRALQEWFINIVDRLIEDGYLKLVGANYPVVELTPKGKNALKEELPISLKLPASKRDDLESNVDTVELTYDR